MNNRSFRRYLLASLALTLAPSGCGVVLGLDEFTEGTATGTSGSTGGAMGMGGATSSSSGTATATSSASSASSTSSASVGGSGGMGTSAAGTGGMGSTSGTGGGASSVSASSSAASSSSSGGSLCVAGTPVECGYSGLPSTKNVGLCKASVKVCAADGNSYGACSAEVVPQAQESCKLIGDEDCDGKVCSDPDWGKLFGDGQAQVPSSIAVDSMGNVVVAGSFKGTLTLSPAVTVTSNSASRDFFLAQFDAAGTPLWIKKFGDAADNGTSIHVAINKGNEIVIAGGITGKADFGDGLIIPASGGGSSDIFVAKFGQMGTFQWAQVVGDASSQNVSSVVTDSAANIILGGQYQGNFNFSGNGPAAAAGSDAFVTKLMPNGTPLWSKRFSDSPMKAVDVQSTVDLAVDSLQSIYVCGAWRRLCVGVVQRGVCCGGDLLFATTPHRVRRVIRGKIWVRNRNIPPGPPRLGLITVDNR